MCAAARGWAGLQTSRSHFTGKTRFCFTTQFHVPRYSTDAWNTQIHSEATETGQKNRRTRVSWYENNTDWIWGSVYIHIHSNAPVSAASTGCSYVSSRRDFGLDWLKKKRKKNGDVLIGSTVERRSSQFVTFTLRFPTSRLHPPPPAAQDAS